MADWDEDDDIEEVEGEETDDSPTGLESLNVLDLIKGEARRLELESLERATMVPAESRLTEMALHQHLLEEEIAARKLELKELSRRLNAIKLGTLPEAMRAGGIVVGNKGMFSYTRGKAHFDVRIYPSVPAEQREKFIEYAKANGLAHLIIETVDGRALREEVVSRRENEEPEIPMVSIFEKTQVKLVKARVKKPKSNS